MTQLLRDRPAQAVGSTTAASEVGFAAPLQAFGLVLCGVGVVDIGLLWWPLQLGTGEWEFGVISRTFDSLALGTTGLVFVTAAAAVRGRVVALRILSIVAVLLFCWLAASFLLYALNVPVALNAVPEQVRPQLVRAIGRTTAFAGLYIAFFGWLGWFTGRRAGAATKGVTA